MCDRDRKQPQIRHAVNDIRVLFCTPAIAIQIACASIIIRPEPACSGKCGCLCVDLQKLQKRISSLKRHMAYPVVDHVITVRVEACFLIDHSGAVVGKPLPELIGVKFQCIGSHLLLCRVIGCFLIDLIPSAHLVFCRCLQPCEKLCGAKLGVIRYIGQSVGTEEKLIHERHGIFIAGIHHPGQDSIHIIQPFAVFHLSGVFINPCPEFVCAEWEDILFTVRSLRIGTGCLISV